MVNDPTDIIMDWVVSRLTEPSTWAGIAAVLSAVSASFPEIAHYTSGVAAICGAVAVALKERGTPNVG